MYFLQSYPIPTLIELGAKIACILHVVRAGRNTQWIWLIIIFPFGGPLIYFVAEIWPDIRSGRRSSLGNGIRLPRNPEKQIAKLNEQLEFTNTVEKRVQLAHAYAAAKRFPEAIETVNACLRGVFKDDAVLTFELAKLQSAAGLHREALESLVALDRLKSKHARYERVLLTARSFEALGQIQQARENYEQAVVLSVGEEARFALAKLVATQGDRVAAQQLFDEIARNAKHGGGPYRRMNREWIKQAKVQRAALSS